MPQVTTLIEQLSTTYFFLCSIQKHIPKKNKVKSLVIKYFVYEKPRQTIDDDDNEGGSLGMTVNMATSAVSMIFTATRIHYKDKTSELLISLMEPVVMGM